jgi:membrane protein implicated in regulation of membrane protease activity
MISAFGDGLHVADAIRRTSVESTDNKLCALRQRGYAQMTWWGWTITGAILLGAELAFVNAQFYLVFVGSAAITVGLIVAAAPMLPPWAQWAVFAVLAVVSMVGFRSRIYQRLRGHASPVQAGPAAGGEITLPVSLAPGESCRAEHCGSSWMVRNDGDTPIPSGTRARIASVHGLTLLVRPSA